MKLCIYPLLLAMACTSFLVVSSWAQQGGGTAIPHCEEPVAGTVSGPQRCNCTSIPQLMPFTHWEKAKGPGGIGTMQDPDGHDIDYNGNPTTGESGSGVLAVPAGKCVTVVYHFRCCPRSGGTFVCGSTGQVTYEESEADC